MGQITYTKFADTPVQKRTCFGRLRQWVWMNAMQKDAKDNMKCVELACY